MAYAFLRIRHLDSYFRKFVGGFHPHSNHRHFYKHFCFRPPAYKIHRPPLDSFRLLHNLRYPSADFTWLRTFRLSMLTHAGVSGRAFQGVTLSFHSSIYQFSKQAENRLLVPCFLNISIQLSRNVSHCPCRTRS